MSDSIHRPDAYDKSAPTSMNAIEHADWFKIPKEITAAAFPFEADVIEVLSTDSINSAFRTLVINNVLSAPVWDAQNKRYLGFVDIGDLMALTYGMDLVISVIPETSADLCKEGGASVASLFDEFETTFASWEPVDEDCPFVKVLQLLSGRSRRVPVLSKSTGRVIKIISQSSVVAQLYKAVRSAKQLPKQLKLTPRETGIGIKKVFTVREDEPVKAAFLKMIQENVSAIGVLDDRNKLFSCVSTKDIRLLPRLDASNLTGKAFLNASSREYIAMARRASETTGKSHASVAVAGLDTPLTTIIGKLAETKMHRIFVVDKEQNAVGVVSVSDVINLLMQEAEASTA